MDPVLIKLILDAGSFGLLALLLLWVWPKSEDRQDRALSQQRDEFRESLHKLSETFKDALTVQRGDFQREMASQRVDFQKEIAEQNEANRDAIGQLTRAVDSLRKEIEERTSEGRK